MSLSELFFPKQKSSIEVLNEQIQSTAMSIATSASSSAQGSSTQKATQNISGNSFSLFKSLGISQSSSMSIKSVSETSVNAKMMQEMTSAISNTVEQKRDQFPELNGNDVSQKIRNVVKNSVEANFNSSTLQSLMVSSSQEAEQNATNNWFTWVSDLTINQDSKIVAEQSQKMSLDILQKLTGNMNIANDLKQSAQNPISAIIGSVGELISSATLMVGIIVVGALMAFIFFMGGPGGGGDGGAADMKRGIMQIMNRPPIPQYIPPPPMPPQYIPPQAPVSYVAPPPPQMAQYPPQQPQQPQYQPQYQPQPQMQMPYAPPPPPPQQVANVPQYYQQPQMQYVPHP